MLRKISSAIVGFAVWTVLWLGGNALLFGDIARQTADGSAYTEVLPLLGVLLLSFFCSLTAGVITRLMAKSQQPVWWTAVLLLVTGIGVQASAWSLLPAWYHLTFLALLVPMVAAGAFFASRLVGKVPPEPLVSKAT